MERYPNPDQPAMQEPLPIGRLPVEIANIVGNMQKGDVSREPVAYQNEFYLFKITASEQAQDAPPFEQVKEAVIRQVKQQKAQEQIDQLLKANGISL